ncbi:MAG: NADH oxidase [Actinomycetota bacterium]
MTETDLRLLSTVSADGQLRLELEERELPELAPDQVLIRVEAAPINPSDLGLLLGGADPRELSADGDAVVGPIPPAALRGASARFGSPMPVGNEGAGTVIAAGSSPEAEALVGKIVAAVPGGGSYARHVVVPAASCWLMPDGTDPVDAASPFVNPMTVLVMLETMRDEGHTAIVHTVGASNLGHMLRKACAADGIGLVEIVRRPEQVAELEALGAAHVCDSSSDGFADSLDAALAATGATLCFDAIGGGGLGGEILAGMERVASAGQEFSRYGSTQLKQLYIYGGLDRGPTTLDRAFGMAWSVGGWLLPNRLATIPDRVPALQARVVEELTTTFASGYSSQISLAEALDPEVIRKYARMASGEKYLVRPWQ